MQNIKNPCVIRHRDFLCIFPDTPAYYFIKALTVIYLLIKAECRHKLKSFRPRGGLKMLA